MTPSSSIGCSGCSGCCWQASVAAGKQQQLLASTWIAAEGLVLGYCRHRCDASLHCRHAAICAADAGMQLAPVAGRFVARAGGQVFVWLWACRGVVRAADAAGVAAVACGSVHGNSCGQACTAGVAGCACVLVLGGCLFCCRGGFLFVM